MSTKKNTSTTDELLKILHSARSISDLEQYTSNLSNLSSKYSSFAEYFHSYIQEHNLSESDIIHESQLHRTYAYQILNGSKNPGRDKVLALCLAAHMSNEETGRALALANLGKLYPRNKRDGIIIFALEQKLSIQQTNELLFEEGEATLE